MPRTRVGGRYGSPYEWHEVVVSRDPAGRWQVIDTIDSENIVVETLTGHDDRLDQALALAQDYALEQQAYRDGRRESDPLSEGHRRATMHGNAGEAQDVYSGSGAPRVLFHPADR
ncbi:MAG: hypothetical protein H0V26_06330 [Solirubrobacterales bacterium]|nr:hypothetical protein [Solirubrobacterales bacterium]